MPPSQERTVRLSVVILVLNGKDALIETLDSIRSIADEIIVIDAGAKDGSREAALRRGATLIDHTWQDSFAMARNHGLSQVTGDWVLWLDVGEILTEDDACQLRTYIDQGPDKNNAWMMLVKVPVRPAAVSAEQVGQIRLVPNLPKIRFSGRVREDLILSLEAQRINVEGLPWAIHRGVREHDHTYKTHRARRDLRLARRQIEELGPAARWLLCIGESLQILGEYEQAAESFRQAVELSEKGSPEMLEAYYGLLTALEADPRGREIQLSVCLAALGVFPLDAQLLCAMGGYLQAQQRLDLAAQSYETAFQHGRVNPLTWHIDEVHEIAAVCLSLALQGLNQRKKACRWLEEACAKFPDSNRLRRALLELSVKLGRCDKALGLLDSEVEDSLQVDLLRDVVRGACLASQKDWTAAKGFLLKAYQAGCADVLCLRWLCLTLFSLGETEAVRPILAQWRMLVPADTDAAKMVEKFSRAPASEEFMPRNRTSQNPQNFQHPTSRLHPSAS